MDKQYCETCGNETIHLLTFQGFMVCSDCYIWLEGMFGIKQEEKARNGN